MLEKRVDERTRDLEAARLSAEQANLGKSKFLAAAGHDLQQPLEAISLFAGMLGREDISPRAKAIVRDLRAAKESMRSMLGQLIDLSRLEVGDVVPQVVTISLDTLLEPLVAEFRTQAEGKGLRFRFVAVHVRVRTDPVLFNRIVRNVLSNAVRHTPAGGVLFGARCRAGALRLEIHDTGPGIPEGMRERIFEEFYQLEEGGGDRSAGIGLGLPTARRFSQLLGHDLQMHSVVGRGTCDERLQVLLGVIARQVEVKDDQVGRTISAGFASRIETFDADNHRRCQWLYVNVNVNTAMAKLEGPMPKITITEFERLLETEMPWALDSGLVLDEIGKGTAVMRLPYRKDMLRPGGTVSGPTMMMLADANMYAVVLSAVGEVKLAVTTSFNINFLHRPKPGESSDDGPERNRRVKRSTDGLAHRRFDAVRIRSPVERRTYQCCLQVAGYSVANWKPLGRGNGSSHCMGYSSTP